MKKFKIFFILILFSAALQAQDPHFTQYFSSPLTLNPAMSGYFKGDYRISANFRQQWWSVGDPFTTNTISYDTKLMQTRIKENDVLAAGILALYDQSLNGGFKNINVSATMAYHKALDAEGKSSIAAGFQFTYATRSLNFASLNFATQFNGSGFDTNIPSNEDFGSSRRSYLDINTGVLYTYKTENIEFYAGGSLYHLTGPNTSFLRNSDFKLPVRFTIHTGSRFKVGDYGSEIFIGGLYMDQAGATEKTIGIAYGYALSEEASIYAGSWYRYKDAIMPYVGINYNSLQFGFSYDIVNSSLKEASPKNGSFEVSLNLLIKKPINYYTNYKGGRIF
ncbi:MAG: PorP/SprF family type IX secretion system membrane protein [Chitinophagaceae bacterium]|nr:PorP/SprF family type IX secretion system membrane protein [Chitinophagaceae bacterium]